MIPDDTNNLHERHELPAVRKAGQTIKHEPIIVYADDCFRLCVEWFGPPRDEKMPFELIWGVQSLCFRPPFFRRYIIVIDREIVFWEQMAYIVGHEMYHRVTLTRRGLRQQLWIDELLAYLTGKQLLNKLGFSGYVSQMERSVVERTLGCERAMTLPELKSARKYLRPGWSRKSLYPQGFDTSVAILGIEMESIIAWPDICQIVPHSSWQSWLESFDSSKRIQLSKLLELE